MVDFLLINSPIQAYTEHNRPKYSTTAPLGLGYLATIASNAGYQTELIDAESEKMSLERIISEANSKKPKIVGINLFSTNYKIALEILANIDSPYKLAGGPHVTLDSLKIRSKEYTLVSGEADERILEILQKKPCGIINAGVVENLDNLPFINRKFFKNEPFESEFGPEVSVITSRGCNYNCIFCSNPVIAGRRVRSRSVDNIIKELRLIKSTGVNSFHFVDDLFNYDKTKVLKLSEAISSIGTSNWRALCRTDLLDYALLEKMKSSGCYKLAFGVESGSPEILKYIGKNPDLKKTESIFSSCKKLEIKTKAFFTIGYPGETSQQIEKTIDFACKLNPDEVRFMVVRAFPGTRLYHDMVSNGVNEEDLCTYRQFSGDGVYIKYHVMNIHSLNKMSASKLNKYIKEAYRRTYK
jgi:radical SAM superfamily enzyme YgiQ (UPF0313 family)